MNGTAVERSTCWFVCTNMRRISWVIEITHSSTRMVWWKCAICRHWPGPDKADNSFVVEFYHTNELSALLGQGHSSHKEHGLGKCRNSTCAVWRQSITWANLSLAHRETTNNHPPHRVFQAKVVASQSRYRMVYTLWLQYWFKKTASYRIFVLNFCK